MRKHWPREGNYLVRGRGGPGVLGVPAVGGPDT